MIESNENPPFEELRENVKEKEKPPPDDYEIYRMWSAISFAVMLIVIGIPLWWKTTEVHRASLPYDEIHALDPSKVSIGTKLFIYSEYPNHANAIIYGLTNRFENLSLFNVEIRPYKIDIAPVTVEALENEKSVHPKTAGQILLVQVPAIPGEKKIMVSNNRIIYFTLEADADSIAQVVLDWFFEEEVLVDKVTSILSPQKFHNSKDNSNRLRASSAYDVIFTVINSDPENVQFDWDVKSDVTGYMKPLLEQLSEISDHSIKSQWLYLLDLGEVPRLDESGWYSYKFSQLPHIITPLEKKLGSGISKSPCIHMILYIASCAVRPLCFLSPDELRVEGMISPQWGAVQILNPSEDNCVNHTRLNFSSKDVMAIFISQFHSLLGVNEVGDSDGTGETLVMKREGGSLRLWELDSLYRVRTVEQITSASLTLQSLWRLLGEISNIVINEEVAESIRNAARRVSEATEALAAGRLSQALALSSQARSSAESAFTHPSLLSLLYFPDDQKYAVYIPLFLPIMIPVIMSLKRIFFWVSSGKCFGTRKED